MENEIGGFQVAERGVNSSIVKVDQQITLTGI